MKTATVRSLLWTRRDTLSLEYFQLHETPGDVRLSGTVITAHEGEPLRIEYFIHCDGSWVTRTARINLTRGTASTEMSLVADDQRRWWRDGTEIAEVAGCLDVDISLSPSTNTLPIRRLALEHGGARDVAAAWIKFPELTVERLAQRYVRTGERSYRYSSNGGAFTADIEVDELGLVVRYPPLWERALSRNEP